MLALPRCVRSMGLSASLVSAVCVTGPMAAFAAGPPPSVTVATIPVKDVAPTYSYIGRVVAIQSVQVVPRVTAFIDDVPVQQGSDVKAGQVLYQLQKSEYQAALTGAQAQLQSAQAGVTNAQFTYDRSLRLNKQGFEAQSNLDTATASLEQAKASVLTAQSNVQQAALNLSYCTITSPIDGRIGAITLTKGNLVTPSTPALATVNQLDPIRVVFSVSDSEVVSAQKSSGATQAQIAAGLVVNLTLPDGSHYPQTGRIAFLSNQIDPQTGTISVYADFENPQRLLLPGAFVNVDVRRSQPEERPLVPLAAVQVDQKGSFVLVVGSDNKVVQQPVSLGRQIGQDEIVEKGLTGGEKVIVAGVQKVRPGEVVNPTEAPPGQSAEATANSRGG